MTSFLDRDMEVPFRFAFSLSREEWGPDMNIFAYVDPAAGGLLAQMLLGGTLGVAAFLRARWHRLRKTGVAAVATDTDHIVEAEAADPLN